MLATMLRTPAMWVAFRGLLARAPLIARARRPSDSLDTHARFPMGLCMRTALAPPLVVRAQPRRRRAMLASVMPRAEAQMLSGASQLEMLKSVSRLVVDTGDLDRVAMWKPTDATTNPRCAVRVLSSRLDSVANQDMLLFRVHLRKSAAQGVFN